MHLRVSRYFENSCEGNMANRLTACSTVSPRGKPPPVPEIEVDEIEGELSELKKAGQFVEALTTFKPGAGGDPGVCPTWYASRPRGSVERHYPLPFFHTTDDGDARAYFRRCLESGEARPG
jgi:hypothetical protein